MLCTCDDTKCKGTIETTQGVVKTSETKGCATTTNEYGSSSCTNISTTYSCISGYYGNPRSPSNDSACTPCPEYKTTVDGTPVPVYSDAGLTEKPTLSSTPYSNKDITSCFVQSGTYYDKSGTFTLTAQCNHK